jgi:hypothetical protein
MLLGNSSLQWRFFNFCAHSVAHWLRLVPTELIAPNALVTTSRHRPHRKHCSSIVAFVSVAMGTCLLNHCPETTTARITENIVFLLLREFRLGALPNNDHSLQSPLSNRSIRHNIEQAVTNSQQEVLHLLWDCEEGLICSHKNDNAMKFLIKPRNWRNPLNYLIWRM